MAILKTKHSCEKNAYTVEVRRTATKRVSGEVENVLATKTQFLTSYF